MNAQNDFVKPNDGLIPRLLSRALFDVPSRYTPRAFLARMAYHFFIYGSLLLFAILLVVFLYRPLETGILLMALMSVYVLASELVAGESSASAILARVQTLGLSASYILAASFLWKELSDGALSRIIERSLFNG